MTPVMKGIVPTRGKRENGSEVALLSRSGLRYSDSGQREMPKSTQEILAIIFCAKVCTLW